MYLKISRNQSLSMYITSSSSSTPQSGVGLLSRKARVGPVNLSFERGARAPPAPTGPSPVALLDEAAAAAALEGGPPVRRLPLPHFDSTSLADSEEEGVSFSFPFPFAEEPGEAGPIERPVSELPEPVNASGVVVDAEPEPEPDAVADASLLPSPPESEGLMYGTILYPKNSFPKGRLRGAGALTSVSKVSFVTIRFLLQKYSSISKHRSQPKKN